MTENGNGVKVSTREIYEMVWELTKRVERLETKVDDLIEDQKTKIEYRQNFSAAFWGAVITAIVTLLLYFVTGGKVQ